MQLTKVMRDGASARARSHGAGAKRGVRPGSREKILNAAERLFAAHGYEACSFRMISSAGAINPGLLHYYFGSKQNLFSEVFLRRARLVAEQRMALLDRAEAQSRGQPVPIETLVRCFIEPPLRMLQEGPGARSFVRIHSQLRNEPNGFGLDLRRRAFEESTRRYVDAMRRACPQVPAETIYWRFNFMIGTYLVVVSQSGRLEDISRDTCSAGDVDAAIAQMVPFLVAGITCVEAPPKPRRTAAGRRSKQSAAR